MTDQDKYNQIIYSTAIEEGISPTIAEFMVAQAEHESAIYTSGVFQHCKNAYGYKYIGQDLAESCQPSPEGDAYAGYKSVEDSAREVARWIKRREDQFKDVTTPEEYAVVLEKNGYFGDDLGIYQAALRRFWTPIRGALSSAVNKYPEATILTGVTFFALLGLYLVRVVKKRK
jgi:hypothetical protein